MNRILPTIKAVTFEKELDTGSTNPWVITAKSDSGLDTYVLKLYDRQQIQQYNAVCKEFYTSVLAREFDLQTPETALVTITEDFKNSLDEKKRERVEKLDSRPKFGCRYIEGSYTIAHPENNAIKLKNYDIERIFGFDTLILNKDRRGKKPNILFNNDSFYLIDHEHSLLLHEDYENLSKTIFNYPIQRHLFYKYLKKNIYNISFDTLDYYIYLLDLHSLKNCIADLNEAGYNTSYSFRIKRYLKQIKSNRDKLINFLKQSLQ